MRPWAAWSVSLAAIAAAVSLAGPSLAQNQPAATPPTDPGPRDQQVTARPPAPAPPAARPPGANQQAATAVNQPAMDDPPRPTDIPVEFGPENVTQAQVDGPGWDGLTLLLALAAGIVGGLLSRLVPHRRPRSNGVPPEKTLASRIEALEWKMEIEASQRRAPESAAPVPDLSGYQGGLASLHLRPHPNQPAPPAIPDNEPFRMDSTPDVGRPPPPLPIPSQPQPPPPPPPEDSLARQSDQWLRNYVALAADKGAKPPQFAEVIRRFDQALALRLDSGGRLMSEPFVAGDANQVLVALGDGRSFAVVPTYEYIYDFGMAFSQKVQNPPVVRELFDLDPDGSGDLRIDAPARVTVEGGIVQIQQQGRLSGFRS